MDGQKLKRRFAAGLAGLAGNVDAINRMNVFPVPDGDTGVNMQHTLQRAWSEIEADGSADAARIAKRFAYGALMGARGNSGTILSQLLKGFADGLKGAQTLEPVHMLRGCQMAVRLAYQSVTEPVEGTILTVAREATEALQNGAAAEMTLADMLAVLTRAAEQSLNSTPNLLPILKEAGVVDAGGMGLLMFLQGMANSRLIADERPHSMVSPPQTVPDAEHYGYDVQFLMMGQDMDVRAIRQDFEGLGWSVIVVGDETAIKVHLHVENPAVPLDYAFRSGAELDDIVVDNMQRQAQEYAQNHQPPPAAKTAVISVAPGDGIRAVFQDLNCTRVIAGGQSMNPDTESFLKVIDSLSAGQVIILPNNRNVMMTAEQAARLAAGRDVRVIPTKTVLQGISAMMAYGGADDGDIDAVSDKMNAACGMVCSIEIASAAHSAEWHGMKIQEGEYVGIVDGEIWSAAAALEAVMLDVFSRLDRGDWELATVYYGENISEYAANQLIERLSNAIKGLEFEVIYGGQPLYPYLISLE